MQPIDPTLAEAFQVQFNLERQNRDVYQALELGFRAIGLCGFACWAHEMAKGERHDAKAIGNYLIDRGVPAEIRATPAQAPAWGTPLEAFQQAAALEAACTDAILKLEALIDELGDPDAEEFIDDFIVDQRESEVKFELWLAKLELVNGDGVGTLMLDKQFSKHPLKAK